MSINVVSNLASSSVAVAAKPAVSQESATSSSANSQSIASTKSDSALKVVVKSGDGKQDAGNDTTYNESATTKQLNEDEVVKVTDEINTFMESMNTNIQFVLHVKTNELIVQVQEGKNHKILKEFPAHELLDAVARMREYAGLLVDKKA